MDPEIRVQEAYKWLSEALSMESASRGPASVVLSYYRLGIRELEKALAKGSQDPRIYKWLAQARERVQYLSVKTDEEKGAGVQPSAPPMPGSALERRRNYDANLRRNQSPSSSPRRQTPTRPPFSSSSPVHPTPTRLPSGSSPHPGTPSRTPLGPSSSPAISNSPASELVSFIESTRSQPPKTSSGFSSISGLKSIKATLEEIVILPTLRPDLFRGLRSPPRGILLFGPPGNGKTLLARTLAAEGGMTLFSITASSLTSKYVGEGEKLMKALFEYALKHAPSLVFIDEVDSILCRRREGEHEASRRLKNEFFSSFDSIVGNDDQRVLLIAATNRPQELDDAAIRRFTKKLLVPMPDKDTRRSVLEHLLSKNNSNLSEHDLHVLSDRVTQGYSCSDLTNLTKEAAFGPLRELTPQEIAKVNPADLRKISIKDFETAIQKIRPSVNTALLKSFQEWNRKFGDTS